MSCKLQIFYPNLPNIRYAKIILSACYVEVTMTKYHTDKSCKSLMYNTKFLLKKTEKTLSLQGEVCGADVC